MSKTKVTPKNRPFNDRRKKLFLRAFIRTGNVTAACKACGISRQKVYIARQEDERFAQLWGEVEESFTDRLEREMYRRGVEGVDKGVWFKGELVGVEREYSDTLAIFLAKARRPHIYRDNVRVEHTGPDGGPIGHVHLHAEVEPERPSRVAELLSGQGYVDSTAVELSDNQNGNGKVG